VSRFADYATSTAFHLALSKPQILCLCQIEQVGGSYMQLGTFRALMDKGLVERLDGAGVRLTDAGRAVLPLLRLSGLYVENSYQEAA
jgi:hypothetical protein